jgi:hypothetical protein
MASINIEIEDILWDLSDYEKQEIVDELFDDGFVAKKDIRNNDDVGVGEFDESVFKLLGNGWRLSKEDEQTILQIAKKIII